jgi:hypothetical protein
MKVPSEHTIKKTVEAIENEVKSLVAEEKALEEKMRECGNARKEAETLVKNSSKQGYRK